MAQECAVMTGADLQQGKRTGEESSRAGGDDLHTAPIVIGTKVIIPVAIVAIAIGRAVILKNVKMITRILILRGGAIMILTIGAAVGGKKRTKTTNGIRAAKPGNTMRVTATATNVKAIVPITIVMKAPDIPAMATSMEAAIPAKKMNGTKGLFAGAVTMSVAAVMAATTKAWAASHAGEEVNLPVAVSPPWTGKSIEESQVSADARRMSMALRTNGIGVKRDGPDIWEELPRTSKGPHTNGIQKKLRAPAGGADSQGAETFAGDQGTIINRKLFEKKRSGPES